MKKSIFSKLGAGALVLTLVTASLVGGTFAKFATSADGTAKATVASWDVAFTKGDNSTDFATEIALAGTGANNTLLPGEKGSFDIKVNGSGADVGYSYTIKVSTKSGALTGMKFYTDNTYTTELPTTGFTEVVAYDATKANMNKTATIYWQLPSGANDAADTAMAGQGAVYNIEMTAEQVITP